MKSSTRPLALPGFELADKIVEAVDFLRTNEPAEGYFVGFSGGKDSIVTLELCRMAGVKHEAYYSCTRIDPPEMYRFIKLHYPEVTWLFPKMTMWEGIQKYEPPLRIMRWCCNVLKKDPSSHIHFPHNDQSMLGGLRSRKEPASAPAENVTLRRRRK